MRLTLSYDTEPAADIFCCFDCSRTALAMHTECDSITGYLLLCCCVLWVTTSHHHCLLLSTNNSHTATTLHNGRPPFLAPAHLRAYILVPMPIGFGSRVRLHLSGSGKRYNGMIGLCTSGMDTTSRFFVLLPNGTQVLVKLHHLEEVTAEIPFDPLVSRATADASTPSSARDGMNPSFPATGTNATRTASTATTLNAQAPTNASAPTPTPRFPNEFGTTLQGPISYESFADLCGCSHSVLRDSFGAHGVPNDIIRKNDDGLWELAPLDLIRGYCGDFLRHWDFNVPTTPLSVFVHSMNPDDVKNRRHWTKWA